MIADIIPSQVVSKDDDNVGPLAGWLLRVLHFHE
jgi:hypothetical protein